MKCMCAQTRPRFILSSEGVFGGMEFEPMLTPREKSPLPEKSPEEDRTRDAADSEPKHYQLSYSDPKSKISQVTPNHTPVSIPGYDMPFPQSVGNLGVFVDETLSMDHVHIKYLCHIVLCQLCRLSNIHPFLSTDAANKLDVSFIFTRQDYCNSLLAGLPDNKLNKLQCIHNHAA